MKKILIIEDETDIIKALTTALVMEEEGYEIHAEEEGKAGLEKARELSPDLILCDIMMPGMDGIEVCRALKSDEKFKAIQIIMLTSLHKTDDIVKGLSAGADDYITKPFNFPELAARVKTHLKMKELYEILHKEKEDEKTGRLAAEEDLKKVVEDLTDKNESLEKFNKLAVGRELEMVKLKDEVNTLLVKSGEKRKYKVPDKVTEE